MTQLAQINPEFKFWVIGTLLALAGGLGVLWLIHFKRQGIGTLVVPGVQLFLGPLALLAHLLVGFAFAFVRRPSLPEETPREVDTMAIFGRVVTFVGTLALVGNHLWIGSLAFLMGETENRREAMLVFERLKMSFRADLYIGLAMLLPVSLLATSLVARKNQGQAAPQITKTYLALACLVGVIAIMSYLEWGVPQRQ